MRIAQKGVSMSSDDCIAILACKVYPDALLFQEFRVTRARAVENVYKANHYMVRYFKDAKLFDDYGAAKRYAQRLEKRTPTEHGIITVQLIDRTWDEVLYNKDFKKPTKPKKKPAPNKRKR